MEPFRIDPLNPPSGIDPMEEVLSLQSYEPGVDGVNDCPSVQSIVIVCLSNVSGVAAADPGVM